MTVEIGILFAILIGMAYLFFSEKLPVDLTAFAGLVVLILCGYLAPDEAFTGFASPAVITMLSIFFVSGALLYTGVADFIGAQVYKLIGSNETLLIVSIMLVAGTLSAFMNNIAATAVLLPAVSSIARKAGVSPSRLFIPLSFGAILGGTTTLVGTPPNILAADILRERGLPPFDLFDFTPLGLVLLLGGTIFMITVGRFLLPRKGPVEKGSVRQDLARTYRLEENLFSIRIPIGSNLDGKTLADTRLGTALGVQVVGIVRGGEKQLAPSGGSTLLGGDRLLVKGRFAELEKLFRVQDVEIGEVESSDLKRAGGKVSGITALVKKDSPLVGKSLRELRFREKFGAVVVAVRRQGELIERELAEVPFHVGDEILAIGTLTQLEGIALEKDFEIKRMGRSTLEELKGEIFLVRIPSGSALQGSTISEIGISRMVGLTIAGILRGEDAFLAVSPEETIEAGDELLVTGKRERIKSLITVGEVNLEQDVTESLIMSDDVGMVEATVAPRSGAAGKTLTELDFHDRYGLQVLALWREGNPIHVDLPRIPLRFGDALLLQGPWNKIRLFGRNHDFLTLSPSAQEPRRLKRAPFAVGSLLLMVLFVILGWQPIHVAAFTAATLVVLTRTITMEEAYRSVEWRAVFLVAAILPVGIAMERTGAAALLSQTVTTNAGPYGPYAVLAGLVVLASILSQALDGAPAVVLLAPVALQAAEQMGISPMPIMMGVSLAASAAFMTPFSHKANLLVMGAGGYKVADYLKVGTPLTIILLALLVYLIPMLFPFS